MATIEDRLLLLERTAANNKQREPIKRFVMPAEGDPQNKIIQAQIDTLESTGREVIVRSIRYSGSNLI